MKLGRIDLDNSIKNRRRVIFDCEPMDYEKMNTTSTTPTRNYWEEFYSLIMSKSNGMKDLVRAVNEMTVS